jgi:DNA-binding MarR family transcriptional regulator
VTRQGKLEAPSDADALRDDRPDAINLQINLRLHLDEVAEIEAAQLAAGAGSPPTRRELCRLACRIYDARRTRDRLLNSELFGEPAWDMLLALYCLPCRGERLATTALSLAAETAPSTGLRWQNTLMSEGLIERGPEQFDARRQLVRLTAKGRTFLEKYLTRLFYVEAQKAPHLVAAGKGG